MNASDVWRCFQYGPVHYYVVRQKIYKPVVNTAEFDMRKPVIRNFIMISLSLKVLNSDREDPRFKLHVFFPKSYHCQLPSASLESNRPVQITFI